MKRFPWFETVLLIVVMAIHLYAATSDAYNFPGNWFTRDDAYYYFKVAQNIVEGHGSTFDGASPTNGYHPLWLLMCVPIFTLARYDLILPLRILLLVQAGLSAATGILIYRLVRETLSHPVAILAASWWVFDIYIHNTMYEYGLETGLASFAIILLIHYLWKFERGWRTNRVTRGRLAGIALAAVFTLLSRLDLVFLVGLAGMWIVFRGWPMRILLPLDILAAVVSVAAGFIYRLGLPDYYPYSDAAIAMIVLSILSKIPLYYLLGLYKSPSSIKFLHTIRNILMAVTGSSLITGAVMLLLPGSYGSFPRSSLIFDWAMNIFSLTFIRVLAIAFSQRKTIQTAPPLETLKKNWKQWLEEGLVYYGIVGCVLSIYVLGNKLILGTASPVSGQIKRWWGDFTSTVYGSAARNPLSFWGLGFEDEFDTWRPFSFALQNLSSEIAVWRHSFKPENYYPFVLMTCSIIVIVILLLNRRMALRGIIQLGLPVLFIGSLVQVLYYNVIGYAGMKEWYWVSEPLLLLLACGLLVAVLIKPLQKYPLVNIILLFAVGVSSLKMAWDFGSLVFQKMPHGYYSSDLPYMDSARFLEENTPNGAMIGMTGGGNVGYYIQGRSIVNMDGLINSPAYFEALKAGQANDYLVRLGVDYIFANPEILKSAPYRDQFKTGDVRARFGGKALMELLP